MESLEPKFHVLAPDACGAGKSPAWRADRPIWLRDEVAFLEPVLVRAGDPFALVGHSYGAAVALIAALRQPERVRALALYEPTLFAVVDAESPPPNDADGIRAAVAAAARALEAHDPDSAARAFIDFWMDSGAWDRMPEKRRGAVAGSIVNVSAWANALFREPTPLREFGELTIPVLYMVGKTSPPSSLGVARLLTRVLPQVEVVEFPALGHMGPVTHPEIVNEVICRFLET